MIKLSGITKSYQMGDTTVHALRGVSLAIEQGDFVAIMGPSGSGKSTLMHILGLLDVPEAGSYQLDNREVAGLSEDDLAIMRREVIGFIFQQFNLLPRMSALENVSLPLFYKERRFDFEQATQLLNIVGLGPRASHRPNELSGGQQQRVAIARSLMNKPMMILADEPTGNLDSVSEKEIMATLKQLNTQGITVIIVTHEEEIGRQARRLIRMRDGEVQSDERLVEKSSIADETTAVSRTAVTQSSVSASEIAVTKSSVKVPDAVTRKSDFRFSDIVEYFRQGFKTLAANKIRSGLSMLGILIGVAAVVAMLALGRGAQKAIEQQLSSLGSNLLVLRTGSIKAGPVAQDAGATTRLTIEDANAIKEKISTVKDVSGSVTGKGQVTYLNKNWSTQIQGASTAYATMHSSVPEVGRFFTDQEDHMRVRVAVIGATVARELFGGQNPIGEQIKINKVNFQVIGLLPEKGATGWKDQDDVIVIPVLTAMHRLLGKDYIDYIDIEMQDSNGIDLAQKNILDVVLSRHKVPPSQEQEAFSIRNMADIQAALTQSSATMSLLLASIAAISLLVGGIGIMNIMLVSVTERTREIGLRKAIGAKRGDILLQFLAEALVVSLVGGVMGILFGYLITLILSGVLGWATYITFGSIILAFGFSAGIGIIFGIYPARQASLLSPIAALRYE